MTPTATERCTTILLREILDHLWLPDVLSAMGVNRLWREHALNHPTYYGELYLFEDDPPEAVEAFELRLSRSFDRPVLVHIHRDDLRPLMPHISIHLHHIRSLNLRQYAEHPFSPILESLCRPADILSFLSLEYMPGSEMPRPEWFMPPDCLADHAPALDWVMIYNIAFSDGIPRCFSNIRHLYFGSHGLCRTTFVLPNPFDRCPNLQTLHLTGRTTLDDAACRAQHAWGRLSELSFCDHQVATRWPAFQIPIAVVPQVSVHWGDARSTLVLADSLPGALSVTFPPPVRATPVIPPGADQPVEPFLIYTAHLCSYSHASGPSRMLEGQLTAPGSISAFSMPSLSDRIVRLVLTLDAWDNFVGLSTFGPFSALEELVLTLESDTTVEKTKSSKLFCPRLLRLVLAGEHRISTDIGTMASFAMASLLSATFPLQLEWDGVALTGSWTDFSNIFTSFLSF